MNKLFILLALLLGFSVAEVKAQTVVVRPRKVVVMVIRPPAIIRKKTVVYR